MPDTGRREKLRERLAEVERTFEIRWQADQRAIKKWQEAHPGNDLVWPDRADMVQWLLSEMDKLRDELHKMRELKTERLAIVLATELARDNEVDNLGDGESICFLGKLPTVNVREIAEKLVKTMTAEEGEA